MKIQVRQEQQAMQRSQGAPLAVTQMPDFSAIGRGMARQGERMLSMGDQMMARATKMQHEHNQTVALDAKNKLVEFERDFQFKVADGYKGKNAVGLQDVGSEFYDKQFADLSADLENDSQREMFKLHYDSVRASGLSFLANHELKERQAFKQSALKGDFALIQKKLTVPMKEEVSEQLILDHLNNIDDIYLGTDNTAAKLQAEKDMRVTIVNGLTVHDPDAAAAYVEKHQAALGDAVLPLMKSIKGERTKVEAMSAADRIWSEGGTEKEMLAKARNISAPDERDGTVERIKTRHAEKRRFKKEHKEDTAENVKEVAQTKSDKIYDSPGDEAAHLDSARKIEDAEVREQVVNLIKTRHAEKRRFKKEREDERIEKVWDTFDKATPEEKEAMIASEPDSKTRASMRKVLDSLNDRKAIVTDIEKWAELNNRLEQGKIESVADILAYKGSVSTSDLQRSINLWKTAKADPKLTGHLGLIKENFAAYSGRKYDPGKPERVREFTEFRDFVLDYMQDHGQTLQSLDEATKTYYAPGRVSGGGFLGMDKEMNYHEAVQSGRVNEWTPDRVPETIRKQIIREAAKNGHKNLTEDQIMKVYVANKEKEGW